MVSLKFLCAVFVKKSTTIYEKLVFIIHTPPLPNFSLCIPERADGTGRSCRDPPEGFTQFGPNIYVPIICIYIVQRKFEASYGPASFKRAWLVLEMTRLVFKVTKSTMIEILYHFYFLVTRVLEVYII